MKALKFKPELCEQILHGSKTVTWRLFDDKNLQPGDEIQFINKETLESFGKGTIISVIVKTFGTLEKEDWVGHETYSSEEEMYDTYRSYYGDKVNPETELKIIGFTFEAKVS